MCVTVRRMFEGTQGFVNTITLCSWRIIKSATALPQSGASSLCMCVLVHAKSLFCSLLPVWWLKLIALSRTGLVVGTGPSRRKATAFSCTGFYISGTISSTSCIIRRNVCCCCSSNDKSNGCVRTNPRRDFASCYMREYSLWSVFGAFCNPQIFAPKPKGELLTSKVQPLAGNGWTAQ